MPEKDIFGNPIQQRPVKQMSYAQKLKEAKAKQKYKAYQAEQRKIQIERLKANARRSKEGLQKISRRVTDKRMSLRDKLRGSIYKKE